LDSGEAVDALRARIKIMSFPNGRVAPSPPSAGSEKQPAGSTTGWIQRRDQGGQVATAGQGGPDRPGSADKGIAYQRLPGHFRGQLLSPAGRGKGESAPRPDGGDLNLGDQRAFRV
jgi:hypothetical protein